jgi:hypothetical protein
MSMQPVPLGWIPVPSKAREPHAQEVYHKNSISGNLRTMIFAQARKLPATKDGPALLKKSTALTMVASPQLLMLSFNDILELVDKSSTSQPQTPMSSYLFVLATTHERQLLESEHIQHTLAVCAIVKQPEFWAKNWSASKSTTETAPCVPGSL